MFGFCTENEKKLAIGNGEESKSDGFGGRWKLRRAKASSCVPDPAVVRNVSRSKSRFYLVAGRVAVSGRNAYSCNSRAGASVAGSPLR